ncbi:MAG: DUF2442 domain-containing protein [Oscillatoriales cyanobacterium RU_3_3]|nr:DUF2442 domain-containing protein [Oscillatoriales cyanobacterium RU_3_3]
MWKRTNSCKIVDLIDGRTLIVPLSWYPRLMYANGEERQNWQLLGDGYAIEWIDLDEHIGVEGLLAGRQSGESNHSFERWLATRGTSSRLDRTKIKMPRICRLLAELDRPEA